MTKLTTEEMQRIVDGAPEGASHFADSQKGCYWVCDVDEHNLSDLRKILAQQQEIERLRNPWISVEEKLPKYGEPILVVDKSGVIMAGEINNDGGYEFRSYGFGITCMHGDQVTHWMPLPQPPEGESDE